MKPSKIRKSYYLSKQEEKLAKFCKDNGISFTRSNDSSGRGKNSYQFDFKPAFLDKLEENIVNHCEKKGIGYSFTVDEGGIHHYDFNGFIDFIDFTDSSSLVETRAFDPTTRYSSMPVLKRNYNEERKLALEAETSIKEVEKRTEKLQSKIQELENKLNLKWWQKALCYVWMPYNTKTKKQREEVLKAISDAERSIEWNNQEIENIKVESKQTRDLLVLAGLLDEPEYKKESPTFTNEEEAAILRQANKIADEWDDNYDDFDDDAEDLELQNDWNLINEKAKDYMRRG